MPRKSWPVLISVGGIAYPFLVYFTVPYMSPRLLLLPALAMIALRVFGATDFGGTSTAVVLMFAGLALLILEVLAPAAAVRAYPVAMSLAAAVAFGLSLIRGPSLVEQLARRMKPDFPSGTERYLRQITLIWCMFLTVNGAIAATTALFGNLALWALWNGLIFYLAAGMLFGGEYVLRRYIIRKQA